jgi:hypothetical protein
MERKFTPGPWAVNPFVAQVDAFGSDGPLAVCQLLWPTDERSEAETEANGHLISVAPDLYEALKDLLEVCEQDNPRAVEWRSAIDEARAAIAKAEGLHS